MVPDLRLRSPAGVRDAPLPGVSGILTKRVASTNSYGKPEQRRAALGAGRWHRRMNMGDTPGRVREPVPSGGLRHHARSTMAHGLPPHASAQGRSDEKKRPWGRSEHGGGWWREVHEGTRRPSACGMGVVRVPTSQSWGGVGCGDVRALGAQRALCQGGSRLDRSRLVRGGLFLPVNSGWGPASSGTPSFQG